MDVAESSLHYSRVETYIAIQNRATHTHASKVKENVEKMISDGVFFASYLPSV